MTVADCNANYFDSHRKSNIKVFEFLSYWNKYKLLEDDRILYLKDWHYFLNNKNAEKQFQLLNFFSSDWLNEFWATRTDVDDDFKFVYVGVGGSWTGFHVDVGLSYSWSANIIGEKRWWLFPPGNEVMLNNGTGDIRNDLKLSQVPHIDVIQKEGEIIFVPSGWHHQVVNISPCVSINHNWLNGCSVLQCWNHLCKNFDEVQLATFDVKDTPGYIEECQVCLKAYCGMNFQEFVTMSEFIFVKRICKMMNLPTDYYLSFLDGHTDIMINLQSRLEELLLSMVLTLDKWLQESNESMINRVEVNDIVRSLEVLVLMSENSTCKDLSLITAEMSSYFEDLLRSIKSYYHLL